MCSVIVALHRQQSVYVLIEMDSPDMEIDDDNYEPSKNIKSPSKKNNLNNSKTENSVSIKKYFIL